MRSIIMITLFLIPLTGLASFPIETTKLSDTTIKTKKETMEEYKIRIQKQLYTPNEKKYENSFKENKKPFKISIEGALFLSAIILISTAAIIADNTTKTSSAIMLALYTFLMGLLSLASIVLIFIFKKIKKIVGNKV